MSAQPLVSVLLPVFNGQEHLPEALRSIRAQTYGEWELVVVDDASTDDSWKLCTEVAADDARIRCYRNHENAGLAATMNRLVQLARGDCLAIQEQDDVSLPQRLAVEVEMLGRSRDIGLVSGVAEWIDEDGKTIGHFPGILHHGGQYPQERRALVTYLLLEQCKVVNAACMFRRSVAEELVGPFDADATMSIDWQFFLHVAHRHPIVGIPEVLVRMRRGSTHRSITKDKCRQFQEARRCIRLMYEKYSKEDSPIRWPLYRRAMARQLTLEGRYYGSVTGIGRLAQALAWWPFDGAAWRTCGQFGKRAVRKVYGR